MAKKSSRRTAGGEGLNITSMMDIMTIILIFLLKSYSTEDISVAPSADLEVPVSTAEKPPKLAVQVVVSKSAIIVDSIPVLSLTRVTDPTTGAEVPAIPAEEKRGQMVSRLYEKLLEKAEAAKLQSQRVSREDLDVGFKGQILLQCDKELPFSLIREVMYTAGQAQFSEFRFVVIKGSG
jgi:biopolymer transport protein ExbD